MRVYLDDERPCPEGWVACRWPEEVIRLLETGQVVELSLDHDLGEEECMYEKARTGMDVVVWLEEAVKTRGFKLPRTHVHSMNPVAGQRMRNVIWDLMRYQRRCE